MSKKPEKQTSLEADAEARQSVAAEVRRTGLTTLQHLEAARKVRADESKKRAEIWRIYWIELNKYYKGKTLQKPRRPEA